MAKVKTSNSGRRYVEIEEVVQGHLEKLHADRASASPPERDAGRESGPTDDEIVSAVYDAMHEKPPHASYRFDGSLDDPRAKRTAGREGDWADEAAARVNDFVVAGILAVQRGGRAKTAEQEEQGIAAIIRAAAPSHSEFIEWAKTETERIVAQFAAAPPLSPAVEAELSEIEARLKAATPGPWGQEPGVRPEIKVIGYGAEVIVYHRPHERQIDDDNRIDANFEFLAHSWADISRLLELVRSQEKA